MDLSPRIHTLSEAFSLANTLEKLARWAAARVLTSLSLRVSEALLLALERGEPAGPEVNGLLPGVTAATALADKALLATDRGVKAGARRETPAKALRWAASDRIFWRRRGRKEIGQSWVSMGEKGSDRKMTLKVDKCTEWTR